MWDDDHDKDMMRNQMTAIILMTALLMAWFYFFMPQPAVRPPAPPPQQAPFDQSGQQPPSAQSTPAPGESGREAAEGGWLALPPVPQQRDPFEDEVVIQDRNLVLTFTRIGARLKRAVVLLGEKGMDEVQLVPEQFERLDTEAVYPLGLKFSDDDIGEALDLRRFDYTVDPSGAAVTFALEIPGQAIIRKHFSLTTDTYVLKLSVDYENLESEPRRLGLDTTPAYTVNWGPSVDAGGNGNRFQPSFLWRKDQVNELLPQKDVQPQGGVLTEKRIPEVEWVAYKSKYFLVALKPETGPGFERSDAWITGAGKTFRFGLTTPRFELAPGQVQSNAFLIYMGPMELDSLKHAWDGLPTALRFFDWPDLMDQFAKLLLRILNWFHNNIVANYGFAIIFLTVLVRTIMYPLTLKSMRNMKKMQALAPEIEKLREENKDDQQEISKKMMELYKERGINPLGGCFPMLLQMPVFIALYRMLWNAYELRGAPFLWVEDLSQPDRLFHMPFMRDLPFVGQYLEYFNILPLLMGAAMVISVKIMPASGPAQNPQQKMMMTFMPIIFSVICYPMAAGLNLYVLTSTILGMVQQRFVRISTAEEAPAKKPVKDVEKIRKKRKQHFYTRAKERQRQQAKSSKDKSKAKR